MFLKVHYSKLYIINLHHFTHFPTPLPFRNPPSSSHFVPLNVPKRKRLCTWVMYSCDTQSDGVFPPTYNREQDLTSWALACSPHGGDSQQTFASQVTVRRGRVGLPPWFLETDLPLRSTVFLHGFFPLRLSTSPCWSFPSRVLELLTEPKSTVTDSSVISPLLSRTHLCRLSHNPAMSSAGTRGWATSGGPGSSQHGQLSPVTP